ncbi:MAG: hypothetical protein CO034_00780 [Parcubacteria group bacterium CG_4_9_14_0_2_um_filter_35_11]|nr:MAG: hypothetical protein COS98_01440 [Parcubacteria group bacterium CG07_land_8_20_14_0_80_35_11]PJC47952.1 MAG: hypothetical protein CO034_00780 [Parcubacteria group bacterium CG_4_9_14_0_2_um_filter_35_11]
MLNFNLLPPQGKEELELEKLSFSVNRFLKNLFLVCIVFLVLLFTIYFYLDILVESQKDLIEKRKESPLFKEFQNLEQKISQTNLTINKIYGIQKESIYSSPMIEEIARIISAIEGVYLNSIEISPTTETVSIQQPPSPEAQQSEKLPLEESPQAPQVIQKEYLKITITGFAQKREEVLAIERSLKFSSYFENIVSPFENIISPENINFIFEFRIKK